MADKSNFVLRWEIDESDPGFTTGKVESKVFEEGGFRWTIKAEKRISKVDFTLRCDANLNNVWKCEGEVELIPIRADGVKSSLSHKDTFCFDNHIFRWNHESKMRWKSDLTNQFYIANGKNILEFHINIFSSESTPIDLTMFSSPNEMNNCTLVVGDKKLQVSKDYLAVHSPVFAAMFYGEFSEKGKEEIEIKDVDYEEFLSLLLVIYPGSVDVNDRSVLHILKLADRFQMKRALDQSMKILIQSQKFDVVQKMLRADQYSLKSLKDHCLNSFTSGIELGNTMESAAEYDKFSADMKVAICDRMVKLGFK